MAIYAISLQPLVKCLSKQEVKQMWFADDSAVGSKLCGLSCSGGSSNYLMWITNTDWSIFQPIEDAISYHFLPAIAEKRAFSDTLPALPVRLGGMGITSLSLPSSIYNISMSITPNQPDSEAERFLPGTKAAQAKANVWSQGTSERHKVRKVVDNIWSQLRSLSHRRCHELSLEKGIFPWLTALPLQDHCFILHKSAFRDAVYLRYGWELRQLPSNFPCGKPLNVEHALICPIGGFPITCHSEIGDITACPMTEVCHCVSMEPLLQPLTTRWTAVCKECSHHHWGKRWHSGMRIFERLEATGILSCQVLPKATMIPHWPTATGNGNCRRSDHMRSVCVKWSMGLLWSSRLKVAWGKTTTKYKRLASFVYLHQEIAVILNDNELDQLPWLDSPSKKTIMCLRGACTSANHAVRSNVADCPMDLAIDITK